MAQTKTVKGVQYKKTTGDWFKAGAGKKAGNAAAASRVTPADYIRLGPAAAEIKSRTSPKRWAQIVKTAHSQGWTVASALDPNTPGELKARTDKSLQAAAKRTTDQAYTPQVAELDYADRQNAGLRQKRLADQTAYDQWSSQKSAEIAGGINAAQQKYLDTIKASTDSQVADSNARQAALVAKTGTGISGDMSGSVAVTNAAQAAGAEQERARNTLTAAAAGTPIAASRAAAIQLADIGGAQARHATIENEYGKAASSIFSGRLKLSSARAADQVKEYTDLLNREMDKASANRDFTGLQDQIKSKADIAAAQHQEFLLGQKGLTARAKLAAKTTRRGQDVTASGQALTHQDRVADREARASEASLNRANKLAIAAQRAQGTQTGPAAKAASRASVQAIHTLGNMLANQGKGKHRGMLRDPKTGNWKPARTVLRNLGATDDQINVAVRWASGRRGTQAIHSPQLLNILPEDVGLI